MVAMKTVYGRIKVFEGFRSFVDGHVKDLKYHDLIADGTGKQILLFPVQSEIKWKILNRRCKDLYWGFIVLKNIGSVSYVYCACKGG